MRLNRILRDGFIELDHPWPEEPVAEGEDAASPKIISQRKEALLESLVSLLPPKVVGNPRQLTRDLWNREKRASTMLGEGLALPHVRTMQAKRPVMGFARMIEARDLGASDHKPVDMIFLLIGPPYDDKIYLRIYRKLGELLQHEHTRTMLREASSEGEVLRALDD